MTRLENLPGHLSHEFTVLATIAAVVGVLAFLWLMNGRWDHMATKGQRWRYYVLAGYVISGAFGWIEILATDAQLGWRHLVHFGVTCLLLVAVWVSVKDDPHSER